MNTNSTTRDHYDQAREHYERAELVEAIPHYSRVIELSSDSWYLFRAHIDRGDCYWKLADATDAPEGALQLALADYQQATPHRPDSAASYVGLGLVYESLGDYAAALDALDHAITVNPSSVDAYINRGILKEERLGWFESAIEDYDRGIELLIAAEDEHPAYIDRIRARRSSLIAKAAR
ncbi:MAG: tetratricopeptide repeat protein [Actinomycetota bacterium]